jgi:hypothetical protein
LDFLDLKHKHKAKACQRYLVRQPALKGVHYADDGLEQRAHEWLVGNAGWM